MRLNFSLPMNYFADSETVLLKSSRAGDKNALKQLIDLYHRPIFILLHNLIGCSPDHAYEITISTFMHALDSKPGLFSRENFFQLLFRAAIRQARDISLILRPEVGAVRARDVKENIQEIVKRAFFELPFESKLILILRDQLNFSYVKIAAIFGSTPKNVGKLLAMNRIRLRHEIKSILGHPEFLR